MMINDRKTSTFRDWSRSIECEERHNRMMWFFLQNMIASLVKWETCSSIIKRWNFSCCRFADSDSKHFWSQSRLISLLIYSLSLTTMWLFFASSTSFTFFKALNQIFRCILSLKMNQTRRITSSELTHSMSEIHSQLSSWIIVDSCSLKHMTLHLLTIFMTKSFSFML